VTACVRNTTPDGSKQRAMPGVLTWLSVDRTAASSTSRLGTPAAMLLCVEQKGRAWRQRLLPRRGWVGPSSRGMQDSSWFWHNYTMCLHTFHLHTSASFWQLAGVQRGRVWGGLSSSLSSYTSHHSTIVLPCLLRPLSAAFEHKRVSRSFVGRVLFCTERLVPRSRRQRRQWFQKASLKCHPSATHVPCLAKTRWASFQTCWPRSATTSAATRST
jgi:hypothetical protein